MQSSESPVHSRDKVVLSGMNLVSEQLLGQHAAVFLYPVYHPEVKYSSTIHSRKFLETAVYSSQCRAERASQSFQFKLQKRVGMSAQTLCHPGDRPSHVEQAESMGQEANEVPPVVRGSPVRSLFASSCSVPASVAMAAPRGSTEGALSPPIADTEAQQRPGP